jgi:1D-myo-inositol-tetrakisphosphate 5-kinase/inositol-polyphosphate multikinase
MSALPLVHSTHCDEYLDIQLSLVVENAAHGFLKPNIIDIKLGTILWDEDALPEKKERMQNIARHTTSGETGVRLTGFQVC